MNRQVALTILLTVLVLSVCFTAATSVSNTFSPFSGSQQVGSLQHLSASASVVIGVSLQNGSAQPLDQPTRLEIYNYIKDIPGVHFRGICGSLTLSVGVVQYHLSVLEHAGLIVSYADGQNKRYFEDNVFAKAEMQLISLMKHETTAKILTILGENGTVFHKDIASCLDVSSQALSWQMNQLKKTGLINAEKIGINVKYSLNDANAINLNRNLHKT